MNVGDIKGAGAARDAKGANPAGSDEPAGAPPVTREEMARDAAMALIVARREVAEIPPPAADTAAPPRRKS